MTFDQSGSAGELKLPSDATALDERARGLACRPFAGHLERTELAAICTLRANGKLTAQELLELTARGRHLQSVLAHDPDHSSVAGVHAVQELLWDNLRRLVAGEFIGFDDKPQRTNLDIHTVEDHEASVAWHERQNAAALDWWRTVMEDAELLLRIDRLSVYKIAEHMPDDLLQYLSSEAARRFFDGVCGVGMSLQALPTAAAGGVSALNSMGPVLLAEAVARAVFGEIQTLQAAKTPEDRQAAVERVCLWWSILKGYIYSGNKTTTGTILPNMLRARPETVRLVCEALEQGLATIKESGLQPQAWRAGSFGRTTAAETTPVADVTAELKRCIAEWEPFAQDLRNAQ